MQINQQPTIIRTQKKDLILLLGCWGLTYQDSKTKDNFNHCFGMENDIINVSKNLKNYQFLMNWMDSYHLFDQPVMDWNAIRSFLFQLQDKLFSIDRGDFWNKDYFKQLEAFTLQHRQCGCYLKLLNTEDYQKPNKPNENSKILIRGQRINLIKKSKAAPKFSSHSK